MSRESCERSKFVKYVLTCEALIKLIPYPLKTSGLLRRYRNGSLV